MGLRPFPNPIQGLTSGLITGLQLAQNTQRNKLLLQQLEQEKRNKTLTQAFNALESGTKLMSAKNEYLKNLGFEMVKGAYKQAAPFLGIDPNEVDKIQFVDGHNDIIKELVDVIRKVKQGDLDPETASDTITRIGFKAWEIYNSDKEYKSLLEMAKKEVNKALKDKVIDEAMKLAGEGKTSEARALLAKNNIDASTITALVPSGATLTAKQMADNLDTISAREALERMMNELGIESYEDVDKFREKFDELGSTNQEYRKTFDELWQKAMRPLYGVREDKWLKKFRGGLKTQKIDPSTQFLMDTLGNDLPIQEKDKKYAK